MANDNIVAQLVQGSKNIDCMKAEIWMVVQMILGFVRVLETTDLEFGTDQCKWGVHLIGQSKKDREANMWRESHRAECLIRILPGSEGGHTAFSPNYIGNWAGNSLKDVEVVYDSLPTFVEGMLREFPELEQKIAPILKASSKFPSAQ